MRNYLRIPLVVFGVCSAITTHAQDTQKETSGMYPDFVDFAHSPRRFTKGSVILPDGNGKQQSSTNTILASTENDLLGMQHYRYQQSYQGIPVEYAVYIMHIKDGNVISENGKWIKDFPTNLITTASLSAKEALQKAMDFVGAKTYKWQIPEEEAFIKKEQNNSNATFYPKATLVFYGGEDEVTPSALKLAYKLDIYANYPISRQYVFVDANTGKILGKKQLLHNVDVVGSAITAYSGTQTITTNNASTGVYQLRETGRGGGIRTLNMKAAGTSYSAAVDFTDADNVWNNVNTNKDQYATDAHWGAEKTYDYYFSKYNRNSVNNAGLALLSYVHVNLIAQGDPSNINAFWDGTRMSYGDGGTSGSTTITPLTALDITGHEISHGVTEYSSNLNYSNEAGALNEAFSDIFGTAIEFYAKPATANWLMGENIGTAIRSMSNPNQFSQPDTYKGTNWYTGSSDNGGVHTNSGVLNYWFYLLSQGGSGTNDKGTSFNVTGIGIEKAAAIAYRTNTVYLTATANYASARTYAIKSAEDLYGVGSVEAQQTGCAFAAVGVGTCGSTTSTCAAVTALTSSSITATGAAISWTAASGASSYAVDYKTATSSTWTSATTSTTVTSYNLSGLTAGTTYDFRVTTNCSGTTSPATTGSFATTGTATGCQSSYDGTGNDVISGAALVPFNTNVTGLITPSGDNDYYKFVITSGGTATVTLTNLSADYDLSVVKGSGAQVAISQNGGTANESISRTYTAGTYYARVIGYNNANSSSNCYTLKIQLGTASIAATSGLTGDAFAALEVYPNPANDLLNVRIPGTITEKSVISILDVNGTIVLQQKADANLQQVNISKLHSGVYLLKINDGESILASKFVKQ